MKTVEICMIKKSLCSELFLNQKAEYLVR